VTFLGDGEDFRVDEIVRAFDRCECAVLLGMKVTEARACHAKVVMETAGKCGPGNVAHGGAIFALADHAFGLAANFSGDKQVALSASIRYLVPARGLLEAVADRVAENGMNSLYRVTVTSGGKTVAVFDGVGIRVP
jgi:acyl-CoA thioesterase